MRQLQLASAPVYTVRDPLNLMARLIRERPADRGAEPTAQNAVIEQLYCDQNIDTESLAYNNLFKGVSPGEFKAALALAETTGKSGAGYYSADVCRSLTFVRGYANPIQMGSRGYLLFVDRAFGESPSMPGAQSVFKHDHIYAGAHVRAYALVRITKLGRT